MNLSKYPFLLYIIGFMASVTGFMACDSMQSPYEGFIEDGEIIYPSKVDSIIIYPGKNRMLVEFLKPDDPTLRKARIFWKNKQDSIDVPVDRDQDTVSVFIDSLQQEGTYSVDIHLYDEEGNVSIGESAVGRVYGNNYSSSLVSRPTNNVGLKVEGDESVVIDWATASSTEAIGSILTYVTDNDSETNIFIPNDSSETQIFDLKDQDVNNLEYQTMFKPDTMAIDTFYADIKSLELENILLENAQSPIDYSEEDGRFGTPADWIVNDAARNQPGGYGGWRNDNTLGITTWPENSSHVKDGKIYKTATLPAGSYSLEVEFFGYNDYTFPQYLVVAKSDFLPSIANLENQALAYADFNEETVNFSLTEKTKISFGFLVTMPEDEMIWLVNNVYLNIR